MRGTFGRTFASLRNRNYRLYFFGQIVSLTGTWMQSVGQAWLVLKLTDSGIALGLTVALQFLPMLVAGPWGGLVADRMDKRRVLFATQSAAGLLALLLGLLTITNVVQLWMVYVLAVLLGLVNLVDMPARQAFVFEMVGREDITNAVSLNSVVVNGARVVGPAVAGLLIASVGIGVNFLINAASYVAVIIALAAMHPGELVREPPAQRSKGQLREGLSYAWSNANLRWPLIVMAVVGTLAYNFSVVVPLLARFTFDQGAQGYGILFSAMGAGAVIGGLIVAARGRPTRRLVGISAIGFGAAIALAAVAPTFAVELVVMIAVGAGSTWFIATGNSLLQLEAEPQMRGRVMALFSMVFIGTTPIGSPLVGWVAERYGPRASLALGALATILVGMAALAVMRRDRRLARQRARPGSVLAPARVRTSS